MDKLLCPSSGIGADGFVPGTLSLFGKGSYENTMGALHKI